MILASRNTHRFSRSILAPYRQLARENASIPEERKKKEKMTTMSPTDEPSNVREVQQRAWRRQQAWQGQDQNNIFRSSRNNDAWVHWEYSPEEWVLFDTIDWRSRHYTSLWLLVCLPSSLAFGYVLSRVAGSVAAVLAFVFLAILMFFFFWRIVLLGDARQRHLARQNQAQPHRITFSQRGVYLRDLH
jgi:hypothetical protein